jgi:large subunit ribosomal protein L2
MKHYRPYTESRRSTTGINFREYITTKHPHKKLTSGGKRHVGRNSAGRITVRHKGGGEKRLFRDVDFGYNKMVPGRVETVEYDPNRSGFIGLVVFKDGERRYMLLPKSVKVGATIESGPTAAPRAGNRMALKDMPIGSFIYNVEIKPGNGGKLGRSAGTHIELIARSNGYADLKMPSTEVRKVLETCFATFGEVSNDEHQLVKIGNAGRARHMGIRPTVRGTAMNPVDHPHGGGEGRQGRGLRRAKSKWGRPTGKGPKTRTPKKYSNYLIVSRRKVGKRGSEVK